MEVAFVIGQLNKEHGGAQQLLYDICRHLPGSFSRTVYYMFGRGSFRADFERHGVRVVPLGARFALDPLAFARFVRALRRQRPDIVHTNSPISGLWGRLGGRLAGGPKLVSVEHSMHDHYRPPARLCNGATLPLADAIVGVSETVLRSLAPWENRLLRRSALRRVILNAVDVDHIESQMHQQREACQPAPGKSFDQSDLVIGTMGRLIPAKGLEHLILAFRVVLQSQPRCRLVLAGDGPQRSMLETLAEREGLQDRVTFTGYLGDVYPLLRQLDIAVFPSLWEGFGLAPVEAMVAGKAIVASDIPTFREVIADTGILVEPGEPEPLARSILSLARDPQRRDALGRHARQRAHERFRAERMADEYRRLYEELFATGAHGDE